MIQVRDAPRLYPPKASLALRRERTPHRPRASLAGLFDEHVDLLLQTLIVGVLAMCHGVLPALDEIPVPQRLVKDSRKAPFRLLALLPAFSLDAQSRVS